MAVAEGVDYSYSRPDLVQLYAAGKRVVCRYVSWSRLGKNLSLAEASALSAAGFAVVTNWEYTAQDQLGGYDKGVEHAREADRQHRACGGPATRPIYFSTDFDASASQLAGPVTQYFRGAASVLGLGRVGVYGGLRSVRYMLDHGLARWAWQAYAWSGGVWDNRAHIQQYRNGVTLAEATVDLDRAMKADYGQWKIGGEDDDMDTRQAQILWNMGWLVQGLVEGDDPIVIPANTAYGVAGTSLPNKVAQAIKAAADVVTVDPAVVDAAVAKALASPTVLAAVVKAINDDHARRLAA